MTMDVRYCQDDQVRSHALPSYLREVYDKIVAEVGDAAVVMLHGWSTHDRTDLSAVAPAKIELALEDVVLASIPKDAGEITITVFKRGRKDKTVSLANSSNRGLHLSHITTMTQ